jgi:phosphoserine phosphatase
MVQGAQETFQQLQVQGKQVHIISGGLKQAILPLAALLNIDERHVHAVDVLFDEKGDYAGFNQQSPLARNGGKTEVCLQLNPHKVKLAMVGDGNTDMEASPVPFALYINQPPKQSQLYQVESNPSADHKRILMALLHSLPH